MSSRQPEQFDRIPTEYLARAAASIALLTVAVIHIVDLPGTWQGTPLIGYGYVLLIAAALLGAMAMMTVPSRRVWLLAEVVASGAILAYVLSRTTGLPTDHADVGNWNCALGIAAISTEGLIVLLATWRSRPDLPLALDETAPPPRVDAPVQHIH
ncbi:MAG: hypothetical protein QOF87_4000 [Pseudonocardiales bacterium]|jgi:hypothetical protein|nr:hypothetical protein [Pseudonocardiales bacterium]MDT4964353.1 hypothetical protein [Pseudonocardiales bacterium]